mmetsp:Transcript_34028/g.105070  ORF Transcript_34028/g.105070 Transcript_34028/m.105070 type:complete len:333 (-) Transcript_34028:743-1741(-)
MPYSLWSSASSSILAWHFDSRLLSVKMSNGARKRRTCALCAGSVNRCCTISWYNRTKVRCVDGSASLNTFAASDSRRARSLVDMVVMFSASRSNSSSARPHAMPANVKDVPSYAERRRRRTGAPREPGSNVHVCFNTPSSSRSSSCTCPTLQHLTSCDHHCVRKCAPVTLPSQLLPRTPKARSLHASDGCSEYAMLNTRSSRIGRPVPISGSRHTQSAFCRGSVTSKRATSHHGAAKKPGGTFVSSSAMPRSRTRLTSISVRSGSGLASNRSTPGSSTPCSARVRRVKRKVCANVFVSLQKAAVRALISKPGATKKAVAVVTWIRSSSASVW